MKTDDLRQLSTSDLHAREREIAEEIFLLRLRRATSQLANPMKLRESRRTLARVKTLLRERVSQGEATK